MSAILCDYFGGVRLEREKKDKDGTGALRDLDCAQRAVAKSEEQRVKVAAMLVQRSKTVLELRKGAKHQVMHQHRATMHIMTSRLFRRSARRLMNQHWSSK